VLYVQIVAETDSTFHMLFAVLQMAAMLHNIEFIKNICEDKFHPYCNH
jgi:hypothetical protein